MLDSYQACNIIFDINLLKKLDAKRLKKFKQSCERFGGSFLVSCCDMNCETYHIKTDLEGYQYYGGYQSLEAYKIWSTNITNIRELLKLKMQL